MSTRSKTTVFDEQNEPILSFYRQCDGYYEGVGKDLQDFLSEMVIVNGIGNPPAKAANGMSCLAAQLVAHFKTGIGSVYICPHDDEQEYNYEVRLVKMPALREGSRISLTGSGEFATPRTKTFKLYSDDILPPKILKTVQFVYLKNLELDGNTRWRTVQVTEDTLFYLAGFDVDDNYAFKRFLKSKIVGGRILPATGSLLRV